MSLECNTDVLVVGAGPVGMTIGLLLAGDGREIAVIDAKNGPAARSYACALHPQSLELFDRLGLLEELLPLGRRVDSVAFYDGKNRRAEIRLSALPGKHPYVLVLPQNALESLLARTLQHRTGKPVRWHHRLSELRTDPRGVVATVEKLVGSASGYIVPHWQLTVKEADEMRSAFLVGADGHHSLVRQRLGLAYESVGEPELFAVFEFETDASLPDEIRVVFDGGTTNVLWPLPGGRYRWSFQETHAAAGVEFPSKDRRAVWIDDPERNRHLDRRLHDFIAQRAPWFTARITAFDWANQVQFERRLVSAFGQGLCWLVGDAAHQTGPVGVQSLNVGLREAEELAALLTGGRSPDDLAVDLETWQQRWRGEWQQLLALRGAARTSTQTDPWVQQNSNKILPCLPASGDDLRHCAAQLNLQFP